MKSKIVAINNIREFWDENTCGLVPNSGFKNLDEYYKSVSDHRYNYQREILKYSPFSEYKNKKILEIGIGAASDACEFVKNGAYYYGIDLTPSSVKFAQERLKHQFNYNKDLIKCGNAEKLPFEDNSFDLVYSFGVIHHTSNINKIVSEIHRVLKPKGKFYVMVYNKNSIFYYIEIVLFRRLLFYMSKSKIIKKLIKLFIRDKFKREKLFKYIERTQERFKNVKNPSNQDLLNSSSDHADCPYASVFNKKSSFQLFNQFKDLKTYVYFIEKNNSLFWQIFHYIIRPFENFLSSKFGWYRIVIGNK